MGLDVPSHNRKLGSVHKPIKALFLTACGGNGGAGRSLFYLLKHFDRSLVEPLVVMSPSGTIRQLLHDQGIRTISSPRLRERFHERRFRGRGPWVMPFSYVRNGWDSIIFVLQLIRIVRSEAVAIIHCNHMMVKIMGIIAGLLTGRPVVLHCRTIYGGAAERLLYTSFAVLPRVKQIIAVSHAAADNFPRLSHKVSVVYNGIDLEEHDPERQVGRLRDELQIPEESRVVGFVGRVVPWKGIHIFLEAAEQVISLRDDVVFVIVGGRPKGSGTTDSEDLELIRARGLEGRVLLTGYKSDVGAYLREIDIVVVPSVKPDPCPRTVIEAMAFGIPVVASALGGIPELIQHGDTGILVEPGDAVELAGWVLRLIDDEKLAAGLGSRARNVALQRFDARDTSRRVQDLMLELVKADRHRASAVEVDACDPSSSSGRS
jgi:glycosyltransferase involved in cell wall biosynthesis